jgi:hypothetical protein
MKIKAFYKGDILIKKNHLPFGNETKFLSIKVETIDWWGIDYVINRLYHVMPNTVIKITEAERIKIQEEWDSICISEYNDTNNDPCIRLETNTPKVAVNESNIKELVYSFRKRYNNPAFEVYRCPKCQNLHLGKNIYKSILCQ